MAEAAQGLIVTAPSSAPAARGYHLLLLTLAAAAATYARTAIGPLQESMRAALSLSDNQMALLQGLALALPMLIVAVPLGLLIDRRSRVRLLFVFAVLNAAGSALTAIASTFSLLFLARCLVGLTATAITTAAFSLLADLYAPAQRGRASMVVVVGQYGGMSGAFALGGALLAVAGSSSENWRWAVLWLTVPLVLVMFAMLAMREPPRTGLAIENPTTRQSFIELWCYRAVILPLLAGLIIVEIGIGAVLIWAAPSFSRGFALAPDRIGAIMGIALMVSGLLGPIVGGMLADQCQRNGGPRRTMLVLSGLSLLCVPAALFPVMPGVTSASVLLATFITVISAIVVMSTTLFTVVIPNELRGLCIAVAAAACTVFGIGLAPVAVSLISGALGGPSMIGKALAVVCVLAAGVSVGIFAFGSRHFPRTAVQ